MRKAKQVDSFPSDDAEILEHFKPFVRFLSATLGPACEVVLHDITDPAHSIIAIEHGELSGRQVGNPATDFANEIIASRGYEHSDFAANYTSTGKGKHFLSSTFYIKNGRRLIGLLCINRDISSAREVEGALALLRRQFNLNLDPRSDIRERIENPISTLLMDTIRDAIRQTHIASDRLSTNEKMEIVAQLLDQGILGMKGAIPEIARQLSVSEPTIYRYIQRIKVRQKT